MLPFDDEPGPEVADLPGAVRPPTAGGLPGGYVYGVTRYADIILAGAFPGRLGQLVRSLAGFRITLDELRAGGGGRTEFVRRFDESLREQDDSWGKRNITIEKRLGFGDDLSEVARVRGHEIDMFGVGEGEQFPGVAVEMEWNNKDPFYDRDLNNFAALHREGAIAVGIIVTRGRRLQELIGPVIRSKHGGFKYGQSTTHWNKLIPRVNLGGGGECPLLLVGIEPERVEGIEVVAEVCDELAAADAALARWRDRFPTHRAAVAATRIRRQAALDRLPVGD
ncbi:MAG TPA: BglII/BstYI family type II restriction endonuclease [Acidimicrobiales bacterium]|nr:BglII/BstYI family type II restriction endonuclease [Acidimicrobiales bacterium]